MKVIKRDGSEQTFDRAKVWFAIEGAMRDVGEIDYEVLEEVSDEVEDYVLQLEHIPSVEEIQDIVEDELIYARAISVAKAYIKYRHDRSAERNKPWVMDDLQKDILYKKYVFQGEGFDGFIERVGYKNPAIQKMLRKKNFSPAGRILAGRRLFEHDKKITYSNCFVITPPEDNLESIFETAKMMARTYSYGGGCGTSLGNLRPRNSTVNNSAKETTGAVSFMDLYSMTTGLIGQQGRRGALMLTMPISHPDIIEFVNVKTDLSKVTFANISMMITDDFMQAVEDDTVWNMDFTVKDTGEVIHRHTQARDLFRLIAKNNWDYGEPAMLFWDRVESYHINSENPKMKYTSTNPCGEKPLNDGGSCLLASMNLASYVENGEFMIEKFKKGVSEGIAYLDDVLEEGIALLPLEEQKKSAIEFRQIGLGIMGLSDALIKLELKYGDDESLYVSDIIAHEMINTALQTSALRARDLGKYPAYDEKAILASKFIQEVASEETLEMIKLYGLRNAELLSIAPTGSIGTMYGVSGGIEPIYAISYTRESQSLGDNGSKYYKVYTPIAKEYMDSHGLTREDELPDFFVTSSTVDIKKRIKMQATWQKHIDAGISSTVNLPKSATVQDVEDVYMFAWKEGLKGVTVFRDGCKRLGILTTEGDNNEDESLPESEVKETEFKVNLNYVDDKYSKCQECGEPIEIIQNGCAICMNCGASPC